MLSLKCVCVSNGWENFTACPDGTLIFPDGKQYYALYWEGERFANWDFSEGFCVKGEDTAAFLEWALAASLGPSAPLTIACHMTVGQIRFSLLGL